MPLHGVTKLKKSDVESVYADLRSSMDEDTHGLVEAAENYRLISAGALSLLKMILEQGIEEDQHKQLNLYIVESKGQIFVVKAENLQAVKDMVFLEEVNDDDLFETWEDEYSISKIKLGSLSDSGIVFEKGLD